MINEYILGDDYMNISANIQWITSDSTRWKFYTNKSYRAKIQIADSQQIYNVAGKPGVVYNYLEDAYEKGNFLGTDGDQSQNRLKAAERELAENMENDIDLAII